MPTPQQLRDRLLKKLKELFQLDQPDLDFGFYRIMHAKSKQVEDFIDKDLLKIVTDAFGQASVPRKAELQAAHEKAIQTAKKFGAANPEETEPVKKAKAALETLKDTVNNEGDVYDHLYRFFERYYEDGDFISRRYYTRENAGKAAPYAIPYNGEEVKLHWANADQYYIKTTEYFSNYTFDLTQSAEIRAMKHEERLLNSIPEKPVYVHFHIVEATEGEHGNVRATEATKRFFIIHQEKPVEINEAGHLTINFEYRPDPEKTGQEGTWRAKRNSEAVETVLDFGLQIADLSEEELAAKFGVQIANLKSKINDYFRLLKFPAPNDSDRNRPLLAKYINQYTARNTMDYFIHKDLGGFLRRELDFYIKNEVMRLDDIENAEAPAVESYLAKIKVLRKIAGKLIDFLAQLEDFQKKLWLKKKFVVETNYCITLDRIVSMNNDQLPMNNKRSTMTDEQKWLLQQVVANKAQWLEWQKLGFVQLTMNNEQLTLNNEQLTDEAVLAADDFTISFNGAKPDDGLFAKEPLTYLKLIDNCLLIMVHWNLVLDTQFFDEDFKAKLLASVEDFDEKCDGLLIHSENYQALNLLQERYRKQAKCVYIDPPYNTGGDGFAYKDAYQHASWITMIRERLLSVYPMLTETGVLYSSIDAIERNNLENSLDSVFGRNNRVEEVIWVQNTTKNQSPTFSTNHEYVEVYAKSINAVKSNFAMFREAKPGYVEIVELIESIAAEYPRITEVEAALRKLYRDHKAEIAQHGSDSNDEWKGIYNYNRAEYRDASGRYIDETDAKKLNGNIWVWREGDPSMPQVKEDSQKAEFRDSSNPAFRFYKPIHPIIGKPSPHPKTGWRWPFSPLGKQQTCFSALVTDHRIVWGNNEDKIPQVKRFLHEAETNVAKSVVNDFTDGEKELTNIFGKSRTFGGPKPTTLIKRFCQQSTFANELVCDFFTGSGTTGQAVINLNREDKGKRKYILIEMGDYFDTIIRPRMAKVVYSESWQNGQPVPVNNGQSTIKNKKDGSLVNDHCSLFNGISHCFKYLRLESYEDTLNNLRFDENPIRDKALSAKTELKEDYMLRYLLDVETRDSQSLLNIDAFADPTAYTLKVKKPGTDEYVVKYVDLIETFNYLIGLRVNHIAAPQTFTAEFKRIEDPEIPKDQLTKLILNGHMRQIDHCSSSTDNCSLVIDNCSLVIDHCPWWFRKVEGWVPKDPQNPNNDQREKVLIVWRKLTGDLEKDNLMLDEWFQKNRISTRDFEFDTIYVNGSNNLPNLAQEGDTWKVRLIEEEFLKRMWEAEG